jgi:Fe2+ transport system protein FeoA
MENVKKLNEMTSGDFGKVIMIRGKAGIHRQLLKLGVTAGRIIHVVSRNINAEASTLTVIIDNHIRSLSCDIAANIKIDVRC